jgi:uncharacterized membrane protein YjjP (DUF1212 family)
VGEMETLKAERKNATFDVRLMTHFLDGSEEVTQLKYNLFFFNIVISLTSIFGATFVYSLFRNLDTSTVICPSLALALILISY